MIRAGVLFVSLLSVGTPAYCPPAENVPTVWIHVSDPRFVAPVKYRAWIMKYAAQFGVPLDVAIRLGFEESGWNESAMSRNRNRTYDHGLYQLNSAYHRVMLTEANIRDGLAYWAQCWRATGSVRRATVAYMAGIMGEKHAPKSTRREAAAVAGGGM